MDSSIQFSLSPLFEVLAISLCIFAAIYLAKASLKGTNRAKEAKADLISRLEENPSQLKRIALSSNEPLQVVVHFTDGTSKLLIGVYGAEAIILYEKLKRLAPHAECVILENGRELKNF